MATLQDDFTYFEQDLMYMQSLKGLHAPGIPRLCTLPVEYPCICMHRQYASSGRLNKTTLYRARETVWVSLSWKNSRSRLVNMITICSQSSNYSKITMYSRLFWCFCIAPHHRLMARPSSAPFPLFTDLPPQIRSTRKHSLSSRRKKVDTSTATPRRLVATISQFQLSESATRTAGQPENGRQSERRC